MAQANTPTLKLEKRTDSGKGAARKARAAGKIPGVIYGHGREPIHVLMPYHETFLIVKDNPNAVVSLEGLDAGEMALVKAIQRHPVRRDLLHLDLLLVKADEKVEVEVPLEIVGAPAAGNVCVQELLHLLVSAPAIAIPEKIDVVVEGLEEGTVVRVGDLQLPEGVTTDIDAEADVASINVIQETPLPEAEGEGEAEDSEASDEESSEEESEE